MNYLPAYILQVIGACLRYVYGSIWRSIFNKPKFTYKDYLNGPKKYDNHEKFTHRYNNQIIGLLFLGVLLNLLI